jgi:hypothetical protein
VLFAVVRLSFPFPFVKCFLFIVVVSYLRETANLYLSPVSAVVQLRPQLHHVDASEELSKGRAARAKKDLDDDAAPRAAETEARIIDVKVKSAEGDEDLEQGNNKLLKKINAEPWEYYEWMDAEVGSGLLQFWQNTLVDC